jgi:hypothetical protein
MTRSPYTVKGKTPRPHNIRIGSRLVDFMAAALLGTAPDGDPALALVRRFLDKGPRPDDGAYRLHLTAAERAIISDWANALRIEATSDLAAAKAALRQVGATYSEGEQ